MHIGATRKNNAKEKHTCRQVRLHGPRLSRGPFFGQSIPSLVVYVKGDSHKKERFIMVEKMSEKICLQFVSQIQVKSISLAWQVILMTLGAYLICLFPYFLLWWIFDRTICSTQQCNLIANSSFVHISFALCQFLDVRTRPDHYRLGS